MGYHVSLVHQALASYKNLLLSVADQLSGSMVTKIDSSQFEVTKSLE